MVRGKRNERVEPTQIGGREAKRRKLRDV